MSNRIADRVRFLLPHQLAEWPDKMGGPFIGLFGFRADSSQRSGLYVNRSSSTTPRNHWQAILKVVDRSLNPTMRSFGSQFIFFFETNVLVNSENFKTYSANRPQCPFSIPKPPIS